MWILELPGQKHVCSMMSGSQRQPSFALRTRTHEYAFGRGWKHWSCCLSLFSCPRKATVPFGCKEVQFQIPISSESRIRESCSAALHTYDYFTPTKKISKQESQQNDAEGQIQEHKATVHFNVGNKSLFHIVVCALKSIWYAFPRTWSGCKAPKVVRKFDNFLLQGRSGGDVMYVYTIMQYHARGGGTLVS